MEENYKDSIILKRNIDSNENPIAIDKLDIKQVMDNHSCIVLEQLPDESYRLDINGFSEVYDSEHIGVNNYRVSYAHGVVYFNPVNVSKTIQIGYKGIGSEIIYCSRIASKLDRYGNVVETIEELIKKGKEYLDLIKTLGDSVVIINKLEQNIIIGSDLHTKLLEDIRVATPLQRDLHKDIADGNVLYPKLHKDVVDGTTLEPKLKEAVTNANIIKPLLDQSLADAQDDINKINSTGNFERTILPSEWVSNTDINNPALFKFNINHNMNSMYIHSTLRDSNKNAIPDISRVVDKMNVVIYSDERVEMNVVLSARYYKAAITISDNIAEEVVKARGTEVDLKARLDNHSSQLEHIKNYYEVNVNDFLIDGKSFDDAFDDAINFGRRKVISQPELGGSYINCNCVIKVNPGRYIVTKKHKLPQHGFSFDFRECLFIAEPANKTVDFIDSEGSSWRNEYIGGNFAGFKTVYRLSTNNSDTARLIFKNPTFQQCYCGIDTIEVDESRSTYVRIESLYGIDTDITLKSHSDMVVIDGGFITHSGYSGANIINQGYLTIDNVIFVPYPAKVENGDTRWIDNKTAISGEGDRGVTLNHCRFGGEPGLMPIIYNYAKATWFDRWQTKIVINDCGIASSRGSIHFKELPNYVKISNCTGFIDKYIMLCDYDKVDNADIRLTCIEIDRSLRNELDNKDFRLFNNDKMYKFLNEPIQDTRRYCQTFGENKIEYPQIIKDKDYVHVKLNLPFKYGEGNFERSFNMSFMLSLSAQLNPGSGIYRSNVLYYVSVIGGVGEGFDISGYKVIATPIAEHKGGLNSQDGFVVKKINVNNTNSDNVPLSSNEIDIYIIFDKIIINGQATILPMNGVGVQPFTG